MNEQATDRVRRFLDARDGYFPIDAIAVVTRTGDRLLVSDLRALVDALTQVEELADEWDRDIAELRESARRNGDMVADWHADARQQHLRQLRAALDAECATCSGRGVWMDEPCSDCEGETK